MTNDSPLYDRRDEMLLAKEYKKISQHFYTNTKSGNAQLLKKIKTSRAVL